MDIGAIISAIPPSAIPIVVVILGLGYLWFKFGQEKKDRALTKDIRDKDSQEIHDTLLRHTFQIDELKGHSVHHEQILDDVNKQLALLNTNIVKLQVTIENMGKK
jgi:uncharacterized protein HemX